VPISKLERLAIEVAISAPMTANQYAISAYISWELIHELRAELESMGHDWRAGRQMLSKLQKEKADRRISQDQP
jgi:hypothetical protein